MTFYSFYLEWTCRRLLEAIQNKGWIILLPSCYHRSRNSKIAQTMITFTPLCIPYRLIMASCNLQNMFLPSGFLLHLHSHLLWKLVQPSKTAWHLILRLPSPMLLILLHCFWTGTWFLDSTNFLCCMQKLVKRVELHTLFSYVSRITRELLAKN